MNNIFKKTLVASAVLAFAGVANAAIVQQTADDYSKQGVAAATNIAADAVYVVLNAEYAVGDTLTITFPGATFASNTAPVLTGVNTAGVGELAAVNALSTTTFIADDQDPATPVLANELVDLDAGITFGFLSSTTNSVTYRVTELQQATVPTTIRGVVKLTGVQFTASSIAASNAVDVAFTAATSTGVAIDAATTSSGKFIAVKDQFALDVSKRANGIIDVADDRLTFTVLDPSNTSDQITLQTTNQGAYREAVTVAADGVKYTITGDFSWVDANANGTVTTAELNAAIQGAVVATDTLTIADDLGSITFLDDIASPRTLTLTLPVSATTNKAVKAIAATTFEATSEVSHINNATSTYSGSAGSWRLNGSQVRVPYMVVGGNRFGIIANVANHGNKDGNITLDIFAEDGSVIASNYSAGVSVAGSVTSVAGALNAALSANGVSTSSPVKFSFQITVNVPENDVTVYTAYTDNTTSERAVVNTDMKVQTKP